MAFGSNSWGVTSHSPPRLAATGPSPNFHLIFLFGVFSGFLVGSVFDYFVYFAQYKFTEHDKIMAASSLPTLSATGRDKLEPRLLALCHNNAVEEKLMDVMGAADLTTVTLMKNSFRDKEDWRNCLTQPPFDLSGTDFGTKLQIGRLVGVFEACCASNEVEVKANAERIRQNLPPEINVQEILNSQKIFEKSAGGFELSKIMLPSKGFFERMVLQVEVCFEEVPLTTVTNLSQDDINDNPNEMRLNMATGQSTRSQKQYLIPMPEKSE